MREVGIGLREGGGWRRHRVTPNAFINDDIVALVIYIEALVIDVDDRGT
jgi:hypothetical protein